MTTFDEILESRDSSGQVLLRQGFFKLQAIGFQKATDLAQRLPTATAAMIFLTVDWAKYYSCS